MRRFFNKPILLLLITLLSYHTLSGQMTGAITLLSDNITYQVSITPSQDIIGNKRITNTGQITLKAKSGSFEIKNIKSLTGNWVLDKPIESPLEAPEFDYFIFNLATHLKDPNYQANIELPLFSFQNKKSCSGSIALIENFEDAFWPPNSQNANIGNQLTILQYDINNAYETNHNEYFQVDCPEILDFRLELDSVSCTGELGMITLTLNDGHLPISYELLLENGQKIIESIDSKGESISIDLPAGRHSLIGTDFSQDTILKSIDLLDPPPLTIDVVRKEKITCDDEDGAIVDLWVEGGWHPNQYRLTWSNGAVGANVSGLESGDYTVTLTDHNGCSISRNIEIEADPLLTIDSLDMLTPSCFDYNDGIIEMAKVSNGNPPFLYAINNNAFQQNNYFEDLEAGTHTLMVKDSKGCVTTKRVELKNPTKLEITNLDFTPIIFRGESTEIQSTIKSTTEMFYEWSPAGNLSCNDCPNPIAKPFKDTEYTLKVTDVNGCEASFSKTIKVLKERPIYVPNIFSPNNDGKNDLFEVFTGPTIAFGKRLQIYNRWGQLIFDLKNSDSDKRLQWNGFIEGNLAEAGVYIYLAELQLDNGSTEVIKGDFYLLK